MFSALQVRFWGWGEVCFLKTEGIFLWSLSECLFVSVNKNRFLALEHCGSLRTDLRTLWFSADGPAEAVGLH